MTTRSKQTDERPFNGYIGDIERDTTKNREYRRVINTTKEQQLVVMHVKAGQTVPRSGEPEQHEATTQFIRIEEGTGSAEIDHRTVHLHPGMALQIPAKTSHLLRADTDLFLYTLYSPPHH